MSLLDSILYVCAKYPYKSDLSKARLNKILYLADWKAAIEQERSITGIQWKFNYYGPYVDDVINAVKANDGLEVCLSNNMYGAPKEVVRVKTEPTTFDLSPGEIRIIDDIIRVTANLNFKDFIELVYSTYPVMSQPKGAQLNLTSLAQEYRQLKATH
ncbi:MAG: SocA family protein [Alphaproteobacteria bacterium]|nr:SocA family protein [Alphaproteobacteria bacterium]